MDFLRYFALADSLAVFVAFKNRLVNHYFLNEPPRNIRRQFRDFRVLINQFQKAVYV